MANLQQASVIAEIFGSDVRRIQQLNKAGVIKGQGRSPVMYDLLPTIKALFRYQREIIQGKEKSSDITTLEAQKLQAEVDIKAARAKKAQMEADELEGKLHRAEDVEAITTDHVLYARSLLLAMPGKLGVDCAKCKTAAEAAERIQQEVYYVLNSLADYRYDPDEYQKRVRQRQGWEEVQNGEKDDE